MADFSQEQGDFDDLSVEQIPAIDPNIGRALWHLEAARGRLKWILTELDEVLEQEFPPDVEALLPYPVRDESGRLFPVTAVSLDKHLQRLNTARKLLLNSYAQLTLDNFRRARKLPQYHVTPEWVLYHLTQHETEHRGQIQEIISWRKYHGRENS
ncbi:DinB family protein [Candidatus Leptofilum sp.]|uniref:DinB family protein n=1 Tax=Candidatus Leptofilum sp. TaxID=3241576 RepID=UPI003B5BF8AA